MENDTDFTLRMKRIQVSLKRINDLMAELKGNNPVALPKPKLRLVK